MTDQKLSELTNITSLADTDELYVNDGGTSKAVEFSTLRDRIRADAGAGGALGHNGGTIQAFGVLLQNVSGTLKHSMWGLYPTFPVGLYSAINGASETPTDTPTGVDSSTAFATGFKIGSATPSALHVDTANLVGAGNEVMGITQLLENTTGTALNARCLLTSVDINGETRTRLQFQFTGHASGTLFSLNTSNIAVGAYLRFNFFGFLPDYT